MSIDRIGNSNNFLSAADRQLYTLGDGLPYAVGFDDAGLAVFPVEAVDAASLQDAVNQMFPRTDGGMGDYYGGEWVGPGSPGGSYTGPAAPAGGWCFQTINGKLTAIACNQVSNNSPQGSLLSSSDTRAIQQALNSKISAGLSVDGNFGPKTQAAVRTFQSRNGLAATGVVDAQTRALLFAAGNNATPNAGAGAGAQQNYNQPPPSSNFNLSSLFSGIDSTTLLLLAGVAVVVMATKG
jgi:hypothetical protein